MAMMEVILMERVEKLGQMGDRVKVKPGYARNFLLPSKKALRATKANIEFFDRQKSQLEALNLTRKTEAEGVAKTLDGMSVTLIRSAGDSGQLYGSVTSRDIAEVVTEAGVTVSRTQVRLDTPIKTLGLFTVRVVLHPEVIVSVTVNVARSEDEAKMQADRGGMVTALELADEEEAAEAAAAAAAADAEEEAAEA
jgi:large subunit ribosomal protein L9